MNQEDKNNILINKQNVNCEGAKFEYNLDGKILGRAFLYIMHNDLHSEPFGLLEDVFVEEGERGKGVGKELVKNVISEAKKQKCYKLIATSRFTRPKVHEMYEKFGFKQQGIEFRLDF